MDKKINPADKIELGKHKKSNIYDISLDSQRQRLFEYL